MRPYNKRQEIWTHTKRERYQICMIHIDQQTSRETGKQANKEICNNTCPLFQRSTIPKVHCADTRHSAKVWVKVRVKVKLRVRIRVRVRVSLRVSGNSKLSE